MRPTLFEFAGGGPAMLAPATAHHAHCPADPEPAHPFSPGNRHHEPAGLWPVDVPAAAPRTPRPSLLRLHAGNGDEGDLGRRSVDCFVRAADDARLRGAAPADRRGG